MCCVNARSDKINRTSGFAVLEALVALAILAAALALVHQTYASGWGAVRRTGLEARAVAVAKARLEAIGTELPLRAGQSTGAEDGLAWRVVVSRYQPVDNSLVAERHAAWWVMVEVRWQDHAFSASRSVSLTTIKLGPAAP